MISLDNEQKTSETTREDRWAEADRLIALGVPVARAMKSVGMHRTAYYKREAARVAAPQESEPKQARGAA